jgi:hypothetical protein
MRYGRASMTNPHFQNGFVIVKNATQVKILLLSKSE